MELSRPQFTYWVKFGFYLGRMEFIWDKTIPETQQEFPIALRQLKNMLKIADISIILPDSSYKDFSESILNYFSFYNPEILSALLIGISIQRSYLLNNSKDNEELTSLTISPLFSIPSDVVSDKEALYSIIRLNLDKDFTDLCHMVCDYLLNQKDMESRQNNSSLQDKKQTKEGSVMSNEIKMCDNKDLPYVFISYSHSDADIVYPILEKLQENGYRFWYDRGIKSGRKWSDYIASWLTHENCTNFVIFISKNSVESENVQDEVHLARKYKKNCLVIYLEEVKLSGGMELLLDRWQSINWYENQEAVFMQMFMKGISADTMEISSPTHVGTIETTFQNLIDDLYNDTTIYRDALRNGDQDESQILAAMNKHVQKLYYFCEKHQYIQEYQTLTAEGNHIIDIYNLFLQYFSSFVQSPNRMSEEAQQCVKMTNKIFGEFVDTIARTIKISSPTHVGTIEATFQKLIDELHNETTSYRDALQNGEQDEPQIFVTMNKHVQKLYYFCEKHQYIQECQALTAKGNHIINLYNSFLQYFSSFVQSPNRMSEEAQQYVEMANKLFGEFVDAIAMTIM